MQSHVHDLMSIDGVRSYLSGTPFQAAQISTLGGGAINFTYRITLEKPYISSSFGSGASDLPVLTVILKHAEAFPATLKTFPFDVGRQEYEIIAYTEVPNITSPSSVYLPKVFHVDLEHHVFIMEDCGQQSTDLKEYLRYKPLPLDTAVRIGNDLGQFLAELHLASHESEASDSFAVQLKDKLAQNHSGRAFGSRITYGVILNSLPRTFPRADEIISVAQAMQERSMSTNKMLVMGDFSPRNMLVNKESVDRVGIVDWELVRPGFPGADVGTFMGELYALRKFYPWCSEAVDALGLAFITRYKSIITSSGKYSNTVEIANDALIHAGAQLFGVTRFAQPKWGSEEEMQQIGLEGLDIILTGLHDNEWFKKCLLDSLLV